MTADDRYDVSALSAVQLRSASCRRQVHVVCSPKVEYLAVITAYLPDADQWSSDYRMRR